VLPAAPPRRRRGARVLSWLAALTSFAILASAGAGYGLVNFYDGKLSRIGGLDLDDNRPEDLPRDARNILIVGSDSRGDLKPGEGTQGIGDEFVTGQRSDIVILAHLYGDSAQAQLVSFPRDAWVEIPAHVDAESGEPVPADMSKLTNALLGGPPLLIDTIETMTGLHIDNYMQIDFDGFQEIVNKLDGVEVCLSEAAKEKDSGIDLPAGRSVVKGDQALAFVRQRKGLPRGDIDRIARQQQFIGAIVRKVLSAGTLANPLKLNGVISVATVSLNIDDGLIFDELKDLALRFRSFDSGGVAFSTVPVADGNAVRERQSVVLIDEAQADQLFDQIRRDIPPGTPPPEEATDAAPQEPLIVAPGSIRVQVFNGAGIQGLGRQAADDLEQVGFQLVGAPGNRDGAVAETVVLHGPDKADSARTLAAAIPGATTRLDPSLGRTLEVVVGASYSGTQQVSVTGVPEPTDPASPPPVLTAAQDPCAA
jgi:LCP family protein required for cell wall assembly